jgi:hypothetical protein
MVIYPEVTSTVAEFWQAGKWLNEVAPDELTPMWADWEHSPDRHFYINEIAHTREDIWCQDDGSYTMARNTLMLR